VNPAFLLLLFCMMLTASIELGPGQLLESVLRNTAGMSGTMVFVYGSALMFVLRYFAGPIAHKLSPIGMMCVSVLLAGVGLFTLAGVTSPIPAYIAATVFYVGVCFMWPTMLGITSERFPQGGAFTMGLMGFAGQFALGLIILKMGSVFDQWGAVEVFKFVSKLATIPLVVFAAWWLKDRAAGGYKAVRLSQS
jgi:MFS family permease